MNWAKLTRNVASRKFEEMKEEDAFLPGTLAADYPSLRAAICDSLPLFVSSDLEAGVYDIQVGLTLYKHLSEYGFGVRQAADDGIWRYLSIVVFPDYVRSRWEKSQQEARFWRDRSRIWLRALWWFVHLSWQGDESSTRTSTFGMSTDDVVQIVERPGRRGFRVDLYRAMVSAAGARPPGQRKIRQLMKLNTAMSVMMEPSVFGGGVSSYVQALYQQIDQTK
ncbi:DUF6339 family protein [Pseudomonas sp. NPDC087612]|uniref:DUF6339 family protein n=1 Tax=Pseudomonas sp. NPDC087612 TaxID=3364441 RepID=UPI003820CDDA